MNFSCYKVNVKHVFCEHNALHALWVASKTPRARKVCGCIPGTDGNNNELSQGVRKSETLLLKVHGGEKAFWGRGRVEKKGDRRVKPRNRRQPGKPRLPWTHRQNQKISVRHCAATTAPRRCCPNCYAEQSHKDNIRSSAAGKQLQ